MKKLSIGSRLTLWYLAIFAAAQLLFGVAMWVALRQELYTVTDDALKSQIEDLTNFLKSQKKKNMNVTKLREEASEAYDLEHSGDFLQIYDEDGNWIFRAPALVKNQFELAPPATIKHRSFRNVQLGNQPFRFLTQRIEVNSRLYTVQTGIPAGQVIATLSLFRRYLLMFAPLLLLAAASGGYWLSRKALSPVDALTRTARGISGSNLGERVEKLTTGDELQRLSDTLNEMLARIEGAFLRIAQFTADASHELRTPISLIRTEAEIVLRKSRRDAEYREALRHILLEAERTSSLVEELLSL
ncbi:MAG: histidine kinase dimerization/phospho-acceptor domain-containing protein, partial [Candidatus Sulfotelmatobacter sp.]